MTPSGDSGVGVRERVEQRHGAVAPEQRAVVLGTVPVLGLEPIQELLADRVRFVVLLQTDPPEVRVPELLVEAGLERGAHVARRIPVELPQRDVDLGDTEPEAAVDDRARAGRVQRRDRGR